MPKLEYFLLCESVSVDQDTNRIIARGNPMCVPHCSSQHGNLVRMNFEGFCLFASRRQWCKPTSGESIGYFFSALL